MFADWNKFKMACHMSKVDMPQGNEYLYPNYLKMAMRYKAK